MMFVCVSGGGVLHMEVAHTLAVDGYIKANSYNTNSHANAASGGSAGSLYIQTHNFTGIQNLFYLGKQVKSYVIRQKSQDSQHSIGDS